jgi:hypothetical protein
MGELKILEGLSAFLIVLPLLRPVFTKLKKLDGLIFLFPLSLGIIIAIFPAYGFRPECIPLLVYAFFLTLMYIPAIFAILRGVSPDIIPEKGPVFAAITIILLIPITGIALLCAPLRETSLAGSGVDIRKIQNPAEKTEFMLRIYGSGDNPAPGRVSRPLMLLVPPIAGSVFVIDQICQALGERGFTVISYSRPKFDSPYLGEDGGKHGVSIVPVYRLFRIHTRGLESLPDNTAGRVLEEERIRDVRFLLSYIQQDHRRDAVFSGVDTNNVFIAGYGIGGGALIQLTASPGFNRANPGVKGIIAIESPVFSAFVGDLPPQAPAVGDDSWFRSLGAKIAGWFSQWKPLKITELGTIPCPEVPALYMVSDKALDPPHRDGRYAAVFGALYRTKKPAILSAIPGAGPLDYSDIPEKFPLYRILFPGSGQALGKTRNFIEETAALMTNFAILFSDASPESSPIPLRREKLEQDIYLEANGAWNFHNPRSILDL